MNKTPLMIAHVALAGSMLLAACGGGQPATAPANNTGAATAVPASPTPVPPTPTPAGPRLTEVTRLEAAGLAFQGIPGYAINSEDDGFVTMEAPDADSTTGPGIVLLGGANRNGVNIDQAFGLFTEAFSDIKITDQTGFTLGGNRALRYDFEASAEGQPVRGRFIAAATPDNSQVFILLGIAAPSRWAEIDPYITAIAESITFFAPARNVAEVRQWAIGARDNNRNSAYELAVTPPKDASVGMALGQPVQETNCAALWSKGWQPPVEKSQNVLTLDFARPVEATQVNVHVLGGAKQLAAVRLINIYGEKIEIYAGDGFDRDTGSCDPLTFDVDGYPETVAVEIVMDTNRIGFFDSIDAVELVGEAPAPRPLEAGYIEQWASDATRDSKFGNAKAAVGPQDLWRCNLWFTGYTWTPDYRDDPIASLTVRFATPVVPDTLAIYHATRGNTVVRVILIGEDNSETEVYAGRPDDLASDCPGSFLIDVPDDFARKVVGAIITTDQSLSQAGNDIRTNIDAVRLIGKP